MNIYIAQNTVLISSFYVFLLRPTERCTLCYYDVGKHHRRAIKIIKLYVNINSFTYIGNFLDLYIIVLLVSLHWSYFYYLVKDRDKIHITIYFTSL